MSNNKIQNSNALYKYNEYMSKFYVYCSLARFCGADGHILL